jgi:DNA-binding NtrC family response regulator
MPGKNGFELMQNIRGVNPSVKTIYMSGDLERFYPLIEEEQKNFPINILPKPFKMADLIAKVFDFFSWESSGHGKIFARNSLLSLEERAA